ncbi:hypothetical protein DHEL01_v206246 [Diaporthe helianthi]|uniref:N-acetyltransferase domain-containing protein n=1 Tax=Diaporthe helianthi TaxID=158607 RepID=A0A2P5HYN5_DIAHE|nr:hypothetical protein DHEL01_v206246 [Diaporthe helianthi]
MTKLVTAFKGEEVTAAMLKDAAKLFSENYGTWGNEGFGKPGKSLRFRACNAFACRWEYSGQQVCWVTQLVVHSDYRERRLATLLLSYLIDNDDDIFGIMSSHPAACKALAKAVGDHAVGLIAASPVSYVKDAKVCGSLFEARDTTGMVSGVDSNFYVDHTEPLEALAWFQGNGGWPLGDLCDGHEFLLVVDRPTRRRSRSASSQRSGIEPTGKEGTQDKDRRRRRRLLEFVPSTDSLADSSTDLARKSTFKITFAPRDPAHAVNMIPQQLKLILANISIHFDIASDFMGFPVSELVDAG